MTDRELIEMALDALKTIWDDGLQNYPASSHESVMAALRDRLARQDELTPFNPLDYIKTPDDLEEYAKAYMEANTPLIGCVQHDCAECKARQEQEPVAASEHLRGWNACMAVWSDHMKRMNAAINKPLPCGWANHAYYLDKNIREVLSAAPIDTAPPPAREWQGLTMDDMDDMAVTKEWLAGARWAEAKLKERNHA